MLKDPSELAGRDVKRLYSRVTPLSVSLLCRYANIVDPYWIVINPAVAECAEWDKSDWKLMGLRQKEDISG